MSVPLRVWVESSKPHMASLWVSAIIIPGTVAWLDGVFDGIVFALELVLAWLFLTLACFADEFGDLDHGVDNEDRLGPITPMQRGLISRKDMIRALVVLGFAVAAVGLALVVYSFVKHPTSLWVPAAFLGVGLICIIAAYTYTMGDHPYGYAGFGDFASFVCFGLIAGGGGYWLYAHTMDWAVLLPASAAGLLIAATINLNNVRDMQNDEACGKITLAVKLGLPRAKAYHLALLGAACLLYLAFPICAGVTHVLHYLFVLAYIPLFIHAVEFVRVVDSGFLGDLKPLMKKLSHAMLALAIIFCACMLVPV